MVGELFHAINSIKNQEKQRRMCAINDRQPCCSFQAHSLRNPRELCVGKRPHSAPGSLERVYTGLESLATVVFSVLPELDTFLTRERLLPMP